jgi:hypothetical protein
MDYDAFARAVYALLYTGGKEGGIACQSTVYAFINAVKDLHADMGVVGPDLSKPPFDPVLKGLLKGRPVLPKNLNIKPDARHGHEAIPYDVWLKCVRYCDARLASRVALLT